MSELNRVVVRYADGKVTKGTTQDFNPTRPLFHLLPAEGGEPIEVRCKTMKALFFVKTYEGDPARRDIPGFLSAPSETAHGKKVAVRFKDGELLCGYTLSFHADREGFFMFPADTGSNNLRVYIVTAYAKDVKAGPAADALALRVLSERGN